MAIGQTVGKRKNYVLRQDRKEPQERQTIFPLKTWPARVGAMVKDALVTVTDDGETRARTGSGMLIAVQYGIAGPIENLFDDQGNVWKPKAWTCRGACGQDCLTDEVLDRIQRFIPELYEQVMKWNGEGIDEPAAAGIAGTGDALDPRPEGDQKGENPLGNSGSSPN